MTEVKRKELVEHWKQIALAVFTAETHLLPELRNKVKDGKISADDYLTAVAEEIIHSLPDDLKYDNTNGIDNQ